MTETKLTCATCRHIGGVCWDTGDRQDHYCAKSDERRHDVMKPTGDFAQDFMDNFRRSFDAGARMGACKYYEEAPPLADSDREMLAKFDASGLAFFRFFSPENRVAEQHHDRLFRHDSRSDQNRDEGFFKAYRLTTLGETIRRQLAEAA